MKAACEATSASTAFAFVPSFLDYPSTLSVRLNKVHGNVTVSSNTGPGFKIVASKPGDHTVGMRVTYDPAADAAYIYVTEIPKGGVAASRLVEQAMDRASVHIEFDHQNRLIGIEVLGASRGLPAETLEAAEHL